MKARLQRRTARRAGLALLLIGLALPVQALFAQLVPERIRDSYDWQTLRTEHFRIHFPAGHERDALRVGRIAERVHAEMEPRYKSGAHDTHITLVYGTDLVNAFATPLGLDQMVLFMDNPQLGEFARFDSWVELLIVHEYTHILTLRQWDVQKQPELAIWRLLLGIPPNFISPQGLIEGVAVYEESRKTGVGRVNDPLTRMTMRTAVLTDTYPNTAEAMNGSHRWPFGSMVYLYGGRFTTWLSGEYGPDLMPRYWSEDTFPADVSGRLRRSLIREYADFRATEAKEFEREIAALEALGLTPFQRLTFDGYSKSFLFVGEDGALKYFARPRASTPGLYRLDRNALDASSGLPVEDVATPEARLRLYGVQDDAEESLAAGSGAGDSARDAPKPERERRLFAARGFAEAAGRKVYSEEYDFAAPFGFRYELYDGDDDFFTDRLAESRNIKYPSLSPDGSRLYFIERDGFRRMLKVAELDEDLEPGAERTITSVPLSGVLQFTDVSPDGAQILTVMRPGERGGGALVVCSALPVNESFPCRRIVGGGGIKTQPVFSPDGRRAIFASDRDGVYNLYSADLASGQVQRLTRNLTGLFYPAPADDALYALGYFAEGYDVVRLEYERLLREPTEIFAAPETDQPVPPSFAGDALLVQNQSGIGAEGLAEGGLAGEGAGDLGEFEGYEAPLEIRPYLRGLVGGPVSLLNFVVQARDPLFRHQLTAGIGTGFPDPVALAQYDYTRFATGLSLYYAGNYFKSDRAGGCRNDEDPLRFLCDDPYPRFEEARGYLRHMDPGRWVDGQYLLGYAHRKLRNARRFRAVEFDARDLNLSGPSGAVFLSDVRYFPESISPELGWALSLQTDYYTEDVSYDRLDPGARHSVEYGVAEGGLSLYLPSFWDNHVNYLGGYGYASYGPDRELQKVRLSNFVRGLDYSKSPSDHSAFVATYEYRLPLFHLSEPIFPDGAAWMLYQVGLNVFFDYGTVFHRKAFREDFTGSYGVALTFDIAAVWLRLPQIKVTYARGMGPAGEGQVYISFNAQLEGSVVGGHEQPQMHPVREPWNPGFPGRREAPGYWRDPLAGGMH